MALRCLFLVAAADVLAHACNRKELANSIVSHYDETVEPKCRTAGQMCKYDRNCCEKLECIMTTDEKRGVASVCEMRLVFDDYVEMTAGPQWSDYMEQETDEVAADSGGGKRKSLQQLQKRHDYLVDKFKLLKQMQSDYNKFELDRLKTEQEKYEIAKLKELKKRYEENERNKQNELTKIEEMKMLEDFERKEVNATLIRERKLADLYKEMLNDAMIKAKALRKNT